MMLKNIIITTGVQTETINGSLLDRPMAIDKSFKKYKIKPIINPKNKYIKVLYSLFILIVNIVDKSIIPNK